MTDSTNPRVMADNIKELSGASGSQAAVISDLQEDVGTLQTTVGTQGDAIEALGTYSTTEVNTGKKWYDGSDIYSVIITFDEAITIPSTSGNWYFIPKANLPSEFGMVINAIAYGTSERALLSYLAAYYDIADNNLKLQALRNSSVNANVVYVEYIKPAAPSPDVLPGPDPDTRSLEEPEPEPIEEKK